jgi:hypothetical protein
MEIKIKDKDTLIDATIEVVDGMIVVSPKEMKFEPKNGDVVTSGCSYEVISIFKSQSNVIAYKSHISIYEEELHTDDCFMMKNIRPATEEEKQKLFDKIDAEGYEWNPDERKLVRKKWKPKRGEICFHPFCDGTIFNPFKTDWVEETFYFGLFDKGWVFRTKEDCEEFCKKLNQAINQIKP